MPSSRPRLEVLEYRPEIPSRAVDVVLLHGICVGAWVWTDAFIQPLLDAGYRVLAVSFRGHGASEGRSTRRQHRLSDFVADAHHVIRQCEAPPVVVGHSLGSAVVHGLLRQQVPMAACGLLSPVPVQGLLGVSTRLMWNDPMAFQQLSVGLMLGVRHVSERVMARLLFSRPSVDEEVHGFLARCTDESPWLSFDLSHSLGPPHTASVGQPPIWVASGTADGLIRPRDAETVAAHYEATMHWVDGGSHLLMYDRSAGQTADALVTWLATSLTNAPV